MKTSNEFIARQCDQAGEVVEMGRSAEQAASAMPDCWVVVKNGRILGTHDEPAHIDGLNAVRYVPAIAQPAVSEPVAWQSVVNGGVSAARLYFDKDEQLIPLYPHPAIAQPVPPANLVPLTGEQIDAALDSIDAMWWDVPSRDTERFARAIEAAHGIAQPVQPPATHPAQAAKTTDAERYQWLTQQQDVTWQNHEGQWVGGGGMDLDLMIDAAISASKGKA